MHEADKPDSVTDFSNTDMLPFSISNTNQDRKHTGFPLKRPGTIESMGRPHGITFIVKQQSRSQTASPGFGSIHSLMPVGGKLYLHFLPQL